MNCILTKRQTKIAASVEASDSSVICRQHTFTIPHIVTYTTYLFLLSLSLVVLLLHLLTQTLKLPHATAKWLVVIVVDLEVPLHQKQVKSEQRDEFPFFSSGPSVSGKEQGPGPKPVYGRSFLLTAAGQVFSMIFGSP